MPEIHIIVFFQPVYHIDVIRGQSFGIFRMGKG